VSGDESGEILASGGVVVRRGPGETTEVLLVHRPEYDDWSLPKGKDEEGESAQEAAIREVREETGHRARILDRLPDARYRVEGRPKRVRWFVMRADGDGAFVPSDEVDEARWVALGDAIGMVDYEHDRRLLEDPRLGEIARSGTVYLVRHAAAGSRTDWDGDDDLRPLTRKGRLQSAALAERLVPLGVGRVLTSRYLRCVETVQPLADMAGLDVETHPLLVEGSDAAALADLVEGMAGVDAVMCSHGDMIPAVLDTLARRGVELRSHTGTFDCKKGSTWAVELRAGAPTVATYAPPPDVAARQL
jgi:8-oxo-(d)GTP phosphatase